MVFRDGYKVFALGGKLEAIENALMERVVRQHTTRNHCDPIQVIAEVAETLQGENLTAGERGLDLGGIDHIDAICRSQ